jgi:hypothetical protein
LNLRVKAIKANRDYTLTLTFTNGEVKVFDVKPYLDKGIFRELRDRNEFNSVKPFLGSIQWRNGQDFCPDMLYLDGKQVEEMSAESSAQDEETVRSKISD